jgi:hypothetical protein
VAGAAHGETVVVALELLLAWFGSEGDVSDTAAVFVSVPFIEGLTETLIVAVTAAAKLPRLHETVRRRELEAPSEPASRRATG